MVDAGDAPVTPMNIERGHAVIERKVLEVAQLGRRSRSSSAATTRSPTRPPPPWRAHVAPRRLGIVHFDAHADAANSTWGSLRSHGAPMRRLIESGAVAGRNFVQVGLRGYWPGTETLDWMREQGMRWHLMTEIEERGAEAVIADAIAQALDGPEVIYLSVDIDVIDPGMAPGTGTPEPGGMLTARAAARRPAGRRLGRAGGHGRGRGLAAVRPGRGRPPRPPTDACWRRSARWPRSGATAGASPIAQLGAGTDSSGGG